MFEEAFAYPVLQLCNRHLVGLLAQNLIEPSYHFFHLQVFVDKLSLRFLAPLDHRLDVILVLNEVLLLSKVGETPVNSLYVLFSHK